MNQADDSNQTDSESICKSCVPLNIAKQFNHPIVLGDCSKNIGACMQN